MAKKKTESIQKTTSVRGLEEEFGFTDIPVDRSLFTNQQRANLKTLYDVVKATPEVQGAVQAIVEDIMSDGWRLEGKTRAAISKTEQFQLQSNFFKVLSNALFDLLITGNAYILKLSVTEDQIRSVIQRLSDNKIIQKLGLKIIEEKKRSVKKQSVFELIRQDFERPKDLQILKSENMRIMFDETGKVNSYQQDVHGRKRIYMPEDIIHLSLINVGGQPYGFSPMEPLLTDIATLLFAKSYAGKFFENDGIPHFLFMMPDEGPDSPNYKKLRQEFKELKRKSEKWRSMILTGNLTVERVERFNKDLEFAELIRHFTQLVLIGFGVPAHRIHYTIMPNSRGQDVNRAFEGYFKKINFLQRLVEEQLNRDLFSVMNTNLVFNRSYKIDEMREAQIIQILTQIGAITISEARMRMGLNPELPSDQLMPRRTGDDNRIDFPEDRRTQQGQQNNPDQPDAEQDNRMRSAMPQIEKRFNNEVDVNFDQFVLIVENTVRNTFGSGGFERAKILYLETPESFVLFFNDSTWVYRTIVSKQGLNIDEFREMRLRNAVRLRA